MWIEKLENYAKINLYLAYRNSTDLFKKKNDYLSWVNSVKVLLFQRLLEEEVGAKKICEKETSLISQFFKTLL